MGTEVALNLLFGLLDRAQAIGSLISTAKAQGRDVTDAELDALAAADDAAAGVLKVEIAKARGG